MQDSSSSTSNSYLRKITTSTQTTLMNQVGISSSTTSPHSLSWRISYSQATLSCPLRTTGSPSTVRLVSDRAWLPKHQSSPMILWRSQWTQIHSRDHSLIRTSHRERKRYLIKAVVPSQESNPQRGVKQRPNLWLKKLTKRKRLSNPIRSRRHPISLSHSKYQLTQFSPRLRNWRNGRKRS